MTGPKLPADGATREEESAVLSRRAALKRIASAGITAAVGTAVFSCGDDETSSYSSSYSSSSSLCTNTCEYNNDDDCDDGGAGSTYSLCEYGTDCADCGTRNGGYSSGGYSSSYSSGYSSSYSSSYSSQYCSGYGSLYYYSYRCYYS